MTMKRFVAMLLAILMVLQVSPLTVMADGVFYSNTVRGVDVHTVNFMIAESVNEDGTFNYTTVTQYVEPGAKAEEPDVPDIDGYKKAGFKNVFYNETPGMEHDKPPAEDIEKAFQFFDEALFPKESAAFKAAERSFKSRSYAAAAQNLLSCKDALASAQEMWDKIVELADSETDKAMEQYASDAKRLKMKLKAIVTKYGEAAQKAKQRLDEE